LQDVDVQYIDQAIVQYLACCIIADGHSGKSDNGANCVASLPSKLLALAQKRRQGVGWQRHARLGGAQGIFNVRIEAGGFDVFQFGACNSSSSRLEAVSNKQPYGIFGAQTVKEQLLLFAAANAPRAGLPGGVKVAFMPAWTISMHTLSVFTSNAHTMEGWLVKDDIVV
jgi:hypothetical protein